MRLKTLDCTSALKGLATCITEIRARTPRLKGNEKAHHLTKKAKKEILIRLRPGYELCLNN